MAKFKLNYNPTYTFTLADIYDAGDNDITFESKNRLDPEWAQLCQDWIKEDEPPVELSLKIIGMGINKVIQGDMVLKIFDEKSASELLAAVDDSSPGYGQTFIEYLILGHWNLHFMRINERLGKSNGLNEK